MKMKRKTRNLSLSPTTHIQSNKNYIYPYPSPSLVDNINSSLPHMTRTLHFKTSFMVLGLKGMKEIMVCSTMTVGNWDEEIQRWDEGELTVFEERNKQEMGALVLEMRYAVEMGAFITKCVYLGQKWIP